MTFCLCAPSPPADRIRSAFHSHQLRPVGGNRCISLPPWRWTRAWQSTKNLRWHR